MYLSSVLGRENMKKAMLLVGLIVVSANLEGMIGVSLDNIVNRMNNLYLMNAKDRLGNTPLMIAAIKFRKQTSAFVAHQGENR